MVESDDRPGIHRVPFTAIAEEDVGVKVTANIVALGALYGLVKDILKKAAVIKAVELEVPRGTEKVNLKAFELGLKAIKENGTVVNP